MSSTISFGTFFAHPEAEVAEQVYIGAYCVIGRAVLSQGAVIASGVQITSGRHQHLRDAQGSFEGETRFKEIRIGEYCWIGAGAVVMADVGDRSTMGAGAVVTKEIPADCVAIGVPARPVRQVLQK